MSVLRTLRLCRHLTIAELAIKTNIPARALIELEYARRPLDDDQAARLATVYGLETRQVLAINPFHRQQRSGSQYFRRASTLAAVLMALGISGVSAQIYSSNMTVNVRPVALLIMAPTATATATVTPTAPLTSTPRPTITPSPTAPPTSTPRPTITPSPEPTAPPTATPMPQYHLEADGPHGCPFNTDAQVAITQGYGVGTHAPGSSAGADDLIIVGAPDKTQGQPVVATHAGRVSLYPQSWPGGNVVMVYDPSGNWTTLYAHLAQFAVSNGANVTAGTVIGYAGATGDATGPHLHYEIRTRFGNIDPAPLLECPL